MIGTVPLNVLVFIPSLPIWNTPKRKKTQTSEIKYTNFRKFTSIVPPFFYIWHFSHFGPPLGQLKVNICPGRCSRGGGTRRGNWRLESGRCTNPGFGGVQGSEGHFFWKFGAGAFNGLDLQFCVGKKWLNWYFGVVGKKTPQKSNIEPETWGVSILFQPFSFGGVYQYGFLRLGYRFFRSMVQMVWVFVNMGFGRTWVCWGLPFATFVVYTPYESPNETVLFWSDNTQKKAWCTMIHGNFKGSPPQSHPSRDYKPAIVPSWSLILGALFQGSLCGIWGGEPLRFSLAW